MVVGVGVVVGVDVVVGERRATHCSPVMAVVVVVVVILLPGGP